jgi:hypothetical protein
VSSEMLLVLVGFVMLCGLAAVVMKAYLLYRLIRVRSTASGLPSDSPERIVSDDLMLDNAGRVVLAAAVTALGGLFVYAVLTGPTPPEGIYPISPAAYVLLWLLLILGTVELLQGIRGVVNLQRLSQALSKLREPPELCQASTFIECPFITPERKAALEGVREKALDIASTVADLRDTLDGPNDHDEHHD